MRYINKQLRVWAVVLAAAIILPAFQQRPVTIFLAGDSTMSVKDPKAYPETGWGMPFVHFWNPQVRVINKAKNGRSTRTFLSEGLWATIEQDIQPGDYVFIQFGHNDESMEKTDRYTTPEQFKANLQQFVRETQQKQGHAVLITPVGRRRFDKEGRVMETHPTYSPLVRAVAADMQVPVIDLDSMSRAIYQQWGAENSKLLFLQLKPGEHPNYPDGKEDNTHFNELGARLMAQLVLKEIRRQLPELASYITVPVKK